MLYKKIFMQIDVFKKCSQKLNTIVSYISRLSKTFTTLNSSI